MVSMSPRRQRAPSRSSHRLQLAAAVTWLVLLASFPADAAQALTPLNKASLHMRIILYDRGLLPRAGNDIDVAVVHDPRGQGALESHTDIVAALQSVMRPVAGHPVKIYDAPYRDIAELERQIQSTGIDVLYVTDSVPEAEVRRIAELCAKRHVTTLSGTGAHLELGIAVAAVLGGEGPRLRINLDAAQAQGLNLRPDLMRNLTRP